ncbi:MAG TPA: ribonuclease HII [Candidatus Nitrosotalea sp.]|nr:ribonuclease HII [Candidatus Nitrosotalea sp.]
MLVCGVDDAGRGSAIGPLVIAGIKVERTKIKRLVAIGVKDSKQLSPQARENMYKKILEVVDDYYVAKIPPHLIDKSVEKNQLNQLEGKYMAKVVAKLRPDSAYVDSCDVNPARFGLMISKLSKINKIHSSHHADSRFPVVSAASILAKVTRDRAIEKIRKDFDVGSGYPSDSKTMNFIKESILQNGAPPKFVRRSWKPVKIMLGTR